MTDAGFRDVSTEGKELLKQMLQKDPAKRPSAAQCLKHPWFIPFDLAPGTQESRTSDPYALLR